VRSRGGRQLCEQQLQAASYVLGALSAQEAQRYREHLRQCAICCGEVADLRPVVDVLSSDASSVAVPSGLRERVMAAVRAESHPECRARPIECGAIAPSKRRKLRLLTLGAAALVVAAAVAIGVLIVILALH
jgi:anti-sigma factor RsiW